VKVTVPLLSDNVLFCPAVIEVPEELG